MVNHIGLQVERGTRIYSFVRDSDGGVGKSTSFNLNNYAIIGTQYLDSQHQELVEEMSDMAAIADNLESNSPFTETSDIHVGMLMMHQELLCSKYNDQISTIDGFITYINDIQPLGSNLNHGGSKEESTTDYKAS